MTIDSLQYFKTSTMKTERSEIPIKHTSDINVRHHCIERLSDRLRIIMSLSELINFYFPWNHQKTYGFLMILGGMGFNQFAWYSKRNLEMISKLNLNQMTVT